MQNVSWVAFGSALVAVKSPVPRCRGSLPAGSMSTPTRTRGTVMYAQFTPPPEATRPTRPSHFQVRKWAAVAALLGAYGAGVLTGTSVPPAYVPTPPVTVTAEPTPALDLAESVRDVLGERLTHVESGGANTLVVFQVGEATQDGFAVDVLAVLRAVRLADPGKSVSVRGDDADGKMVALLNYRSSTVASVDALTAAGVLDVAEAAPRVLNLSGNGSSGGGGG